MRVRTLIRILRSGLFGFHTCGGRVRGIRSGLGLEVLRFSFLTLRTCGWPAISGTLLPTPCSRDASLHYIHSGMSFPELPRAGVVRSSIDVDSSGTLMHSGAVIPWSLPLRNSGAWAFAWLCYQADRNAHSDPKHSSTFRALFPGALGLQTNRSSRRSRCCRTLAKELGYRNTGREVSCWWGHSALL